MHLQCLLLLQALALLFLFPLQAYEGELTDDEEYSGSPTAKKAKAKQKKQKEQKESVDARCAGPRGPPVGGQLDIGWSDMRPSWQPTHRISCHRIALQ